MKYPQLALAFLFVFTSSSLAADVKGARLKIGKDETLTGAWATIAGGMNNRATGMLSVISGGTNNFTGGRESVIAGGRENYIERAKHTVISGGHSNAILMSMAEHATISGGEQNTNNGMWAAIGGGLKNYITMEGESSGIFSGVSNIIDSEYAFIGGGISNYLHDQYGVIAGGWQNQDEGYYSAILGGAYNVIVPYHGTAVAGNGDVIAGGSWNTNGGGWSFIGAGFANSITGAMHSIGAGRNNRIVGSGMSEGHVIGGGEYNVVGSDYFGVGSHFDSVGGGYANKVFSYEAGTIAGGYDNLISEDAFWASISGGNGNAITNCNAGSIGGGYGNLVTGDLAAVSGGAQARARVYGQLAHASGTFVNPGEAQLSHYVLRRSTSNAATNELFLNGSSERMTIPSGGTWTFDIQIAARSGNNSAGFHFDGVAENVGGAAGLLAANKRVLARDIVSWDATVSTTSDALVIQVNGDDSNIRWVATVRTTEVQN